jgi:hypothetical protein
MEYPIRFEYDDQCLDIIDKINKALEEHNLMLECDEKEHDGFELFRLRKINGDS